MKKKLVLFALLLSSIACYPARIGMGKYVTEDYNTQSADGMIKVTYTFENDSLFIDAYPSGCGIAAMSFEYDDEIHEYKAIETLYDEKTNEAIHKRIYHLMFLPCEWDENSLAVYRDGVIIDIIRKIP